MKKSYTQDQYQAAKSVSLVEYLKSKGHEFKKEGYRYRHTIHDSLIVSEDNKWFWNSRGIFGANAVSYLHQAESMSIPEAVLELNKETHTAVQPIQKSEQKQKSSRPFVLPNSATDFRRAFAYLNITRGIDQEIISALMRDKKIYEALPYHNVVFLGFDEDGTPRHAAVCGTYTKGGQKPFKGELPGSDKSCGFHIPGATKTVYVFESPIDAMSYATLLKMAGDDWTNDHRLSLCCTWDGALARFLKHHDIEKIVFCLDNDAAGNTASDKYMCKYFDMGFDVERIKPVLKDFNDDLIKSQVLKEGAEL